MTAQEALANIQEQLKGVEGLIQNRFYAVISNAKESSREQLKDLHKGVLEAFKVVQDQLERIQYRIQDNELNNDIINEGKRLINETAFQFAREGIALLNRTTDETTRPVEKKIFSSIYKAIEHHATELDNVLKLAQNEHTKGSIPKNNLVVEADSLKRKNPPPQQKKKNSPLNDAVAKQIDTHVNEEITAEKATDTPAKKPEEILLPYPDEEWRKDNEIFFGTLKETKPRDTAPPIPTESNEAKPANVPAAQHASTKNFALDIDPATGEVKIIEKPPKMLESTFLTRFFNMLTNAFRTLFATIADAFSKKADPHKNIHKETEKEANAFYTQLNSSAQSLNTMGKNQEAPPTTSNRPAPEEIRNVAKAAAKLTEAEPLNSTENTPNPPKPR